MHLPKNASNHTESQASLPKDSSISDAEQSGSAEDGHGVDATQAVQGETDPGVSSAIHTYQDNEEEEDQFFDFEEKDTQRAIAAKERGNKLFVDGRYEEALDAYAESLLLVEDKEVELRATFHNNKAAAHFMLKQWEDVIEETTYAIELKKDFVKALHRRARAYEKLEQLTEARADFKAVFDLSPSAELQRKIAELDKEIEKKFEKQKEEILSMAKSLGNTILGKFGMSLDDFKAVKDPVTGSYSISLNSNRGGDQ